MIIRILTEDKNPEAIRDLCSKCFDGFTMYYGTGSWKGQLERSLIIEIAVFSPEAWMSGIHEQMKAVQLARDIKELNAQESVLIEYLESTNVLM